MERIVDTADKDGDMIRAAKQGDVDALVALGFEMHLESRFCGERYEQDKVRALMSALIGGEGVVFVAERDGEVIGGIAGGVTERWFSRTKVAFDYGLFVRKGVRHGIIAMKLVSALVRWAQSMGITCVECGVVSGVHPENTAQLYEAIGFDRVGILLEVNT